MEKLRKISKCVAEHARNGNSKAALRCIDKLGEQNIKPDVAIMNSVIYSFAKQKDLDGARNAFDKMKEFNLKADVISYSSLLHVAAQSAQPKTALQILESMYKNDVQPNTQVVNSVISACSKANDAHRCIYYFQKFFNVDGFTPNVVSFNIMMGVETNINDAMTWWNGMEAHQLEPTIISYNTILQILCRENDMKAAVDWFYKIERSPNCIPDTNSYNMLIYALIKNNEIQLAEKFEARMGKAKVEKNGGTYSALMTRPSKKHKLPPERCVQLFENMLVDGIEPSEQHYAIVLDAFSHAKDPSGAKLWLDNLAAAGHVPTNVHARTVLNLYIERIMY